MELPSTWVSIKIFFPEESFFLVNPIQHPYYIWFPKLIEVTSANLDRSYRRAPKGAADGKDDEGAGICHLCLAGHAFDWEDLTLYQIYDVLYVILFFSPYLDIYQNSPPTNIRIHWHNCVYNILLCVGGLCVCMCACWEVWRFVVFGGVGKNSCFGMFNIYAFKCEECS